MPSLIASNSRDISGTAVWDGYSGIGKHYLSWLELGAGADTQTWYGDNGISQTQSGISGWIRG